VLPEVSSLKVRDVDILFRNIYITVSRTGYQGKWGSTWKERMKMLIENYTIKHTDVSDDAGKISCDPEMQFSKG
jgi:hypothetical protein